jgi:hypothetical protein
MDLREIARMWETRNECRLLVGKPEGTRPLGRPRRRWVDNIKMDLREIARMGETRNACRILVGKPEGKRALGRSRRRWVDNIKMNLRQIAWDCVDWIELAQDRDQLRALVNTVMNLLVP